jgi:hypothetical protein
MALPAGGGISQFAGVPISYFGRRGWQCLWMVASGTDVHNTAPFQQAIVRIGSASWNATTSATNRSTENSVSEGGKSYVFGIMN